MSNQKKVYKYEIMRKEEECTNCSVMSRPGKTLDSCTSIKDSKTAIMPRLAVKTVVQAAENKPQRKMLIDKYQAEKKRESGTYHLVLL